MAPPKTRVPCTGIHSQECVTAFWSGVSAPDDRGCRLWTGHTATNPRGQVSGRFPGGPRGINGPRTVIAYRFAWCAANRLLIPEGLDVLHSCDTPMCCEPTHLRLGTQAENSRDMLERHVNAAGGEGHGVAKLTHREAWEVYQLANARPRPMTLQEIGDSYGILKNSVGNLAAGRNRRYSVALIESRVKAA